ncbi:MAG TPA: metal-binding protein [Planctomycetota bacterium]|jgi:hypothetical protein
MNLNFSYLGRSGLQQDGKSALLNLMPNLSRDQVSFDAPLLKPLRFREAISALHDVVISDLRYKPRDKSAYEEWKKSERKRQTEFRAQAYEHAKDEILRMREQPVAPDLEKQFEKNRKKYWTARQKYADYLRANDPELWRLLMPCDPIVTVADDVVFFECFSADESSYGCLTVQRDGGFGHCDSVKTGTTNVDYSWDLFDHFQSLRTYRETRLRVDPHGFEVATKGSADYREEKIDVPDGWLRGFFQLQAAMGLPMRRVSLSREAFYNTLVFLRRHKAHQSPRALRFELLLDKPPVVVLEPWEQRIVSQDTRYQGPSGEPIRVWGKQRLLSLARALPLIERVDVYLLGTGLPSFWVAVMGEMRLTLGLSGWTTNDWTKGSALELLAPPTEFPRRLVYDLARFLKERGHATFKELQQKAVASPTVTAATLNYMAHSGQIIRDLSADVFRWRQALPRIEGEDAVMFAPENKELAASKDILLSGKVKVTSRQDVPNGAMLITGTVEGKDVEAIVDADKNIKRAKCICSHHYQFGIRKGPCRHLLALRAVALRGENAEAADWYERLTRWARS